MTIECERCGGSFEVTKSRRRFCSIACRRGAAQIQKVCVGCGKSFATFKSDKQTFCTWDCYQSRPRTPSPSSVKLACQMCGATYYRRKSATASSRFCSASCLGTSNGLRRAKGPTTAVVKPCAVCGEAVRVIPSLAHRKKYCSARCRTIGTNLSDNNNSRPRSSKIADDSIIAWAEMELLGSNLDWQPEHRLSRWTIDLAFPGQMWAIELDGEYWHSLPQVAEKDALRDEAFVARGWSVFRIKMRQGETADFIGTRIALAVRLLAEHAQDGPVVLKEEGRQAAA